MDALDNELVTMLRGMARSGKQPSAMLRAIIAHLPSKQKAGPLPAVDRCLLVGYFAAAFCFRDGQGQPIFGWFPDGRGELADADIDRILSKRIGQTQSAWDHAPLSDPDMT